MNDTVDWTKYKLVVFDVDGTLYDQKKLRFTMIYQLLKQAVLTLDFSVFPIIKHYRNYREHLGDHEVSDFDTVLIKNTSDVTGYSEEKVISVINEWIETRPLKFLNAAKFEGLDELFLSLERNDKIIGIFSDYKATAKLEALGLNADFIVSAQDEHVKLLKPNPQGLNVIIKKSGVSPSETILIGDRDDRDGESARRANVDYLIKTTKLKSKNTFVNFYDELFSPLLKNNN
jgi:HAD superfamily hydrolase (TIGR01549 family)